MSMNECRRMAARMDQHMQQLSAEGVQDRQVIIDRMMGYVPELQCHLDRNIGRPTRGTVP